MSYDLFFKGLCNQLVAMGWQVWVYTKLPRDLDTSTYSVTFINADLPRKFELSKYLRSALQLRHLVKKIQPSIVHAHFQPAALVVRLSGIQHKTITLTTSHGLVFNTMQNKWKARLFKAIEVFIYRGFKKAWVLTASDENALKDKVPSLQSYPTKGLGCDTHIFDPTRFSDIQNAMLKESLGIHPADFIFIFVGRMTDFKGIDVVYRSFIEVHRKYPATTLLILGDVDPSHSSGLTAQEMADLKSNTAIKHLGFTLDVAPYLAMAQVLVFPSSKEGMPVNLMEAICMGVPIITLNARGCIDVVGDQYGIVLDTKTVTACTKAMEYLISNPTARHAIKEQQLNDRHLFDRELFFDYQIKVYMQLLNRLD
jgi:glycosyltransferase involved in cell wall biosynthesis